jgi:hypothetical protein
MQLNGVTSQKSNILHSYGNPYLVISGTFLLRYIFFSILITLFISNLQISPKSLGLIQKRFDVTDNKTEITNIKSKEQNSDYLFGAQNLPHDINFSAFENEEDDDETLSIKKQLAKTSLLTNFLHKKTSQNEVKISKFDYFNKYFSFKSSKRYKEFNVFKI